MSALEPTPEAVEALAGIHAQHRYVDVRGDYEVGDGRRYFGCSCGWTHDVDGMSGYWSWVEEHERHVSSTVLAAGYARDEGRRRETLLDLAGAIRLRIRTHGAGMRHGCDAGRSNYCEAWRLILADVEALANTPDIHHDTTNEENPC